jgi:protein-disulfide isomerase
VSNRAEQRRRQRQAKPATSEAGSGRPIYWILGAAGVLALLVVGWNVVSSLLDDTVRAPVDLEVDSPQELLRLATGIERGDAEAPVRIMEFSDYQCPACQDFFHRTKPFLDREFVEEGKALFVYFDFPLASIHPNAFLAARAARCAGDQDAYWPYHDRLFQTQPEWSGLSDPAGRFENLAGDVGLDRSEFRSCLRSDRYADVVTANMRLGEQLGVSGTPSIILDTGEGRPVRVQDWSIQSLREVLNEALGEDPEGASAGARG